MGINYNRLVIQERRQKIWTLITRGMKGYEIAKVLGVDPATVSRDIAYLAAQSQNYLNQPRIRKEEIHLTGIILKLIC